MGIGYYFVGFMAAFLLVGVPVISVRFGLLSKLNNSIHLIEKPMPGLTTLALPGRCSLYFHDKPIQPFFTITAECPGVDSLRTWPLPMVYPWVEDWRETIPLQQTG